VAEINDNRTEETRPGKEIGVHCMDCGAFIGSITEHIYCAPCIGKRKEFIRVEFVARQEEVPMPKATKCRGCGIKISVGVECSDCRQANTAMQEGIDVRTKEQDMHCPDCEWSHTEDMYCPFRVARAIVTADTTECFVPDLVAIRVWSQRGGDVTEKLAEFFANDFDRDDVS